MPFFTFANPAPNPPWIWAHVQNPANNQQVWVRLTYAWAPPVKATFKTGAREGTYVLDTNGAWYPVHFIAKWKPV